METLFKKKAELKELLEHKTQGALDRAHFLNTDQMDARSKYLFGHEKKNGQKHLIHALHSEDGTLSNLRQICEVAMWFYQSLYRSELQPKNGEKISFPR